MTIYLVKGYLDVAATSLADAQALYTALLDPADADNAATIDRVTGKLETLVQSDTGEPLVISSIDDAAGTISSWVTDVSTALALGIGDPDAHNAQQYAGLTEFDITGSTRTGTLPLNTTQLQTALSGNNAGRPRGNAPTQGAQRFTLQLRKTTSGVTETVALLGVSIRPGVLTTPPVDITSPAYLTAVESVANFQPKDADLTAIAALTTAPFGRSLLTETTAPTTRATLGLGSLSTSTAFEVYALGDSLTAGGNYAARLLTLLGATWHVSNYGIGGATTTQMAARIAQITAGGDGNKLIIWGGINDIAAGTDAATIQANLQAIYTAAHNAGLKVIALKISPFGSNASWSAPRQAVLAAVNTWISSTAINVDVIVDTYTLLLGTGNNLNAAYDSGDGLHLNDTGYDLVGSTIHAATTWVATAEANPHARIGDSVTTEFYSLGSGKIATAAALYLDNPTDSSAFALDGAFATRGGISVGRNGYFGGTLGAGLATITSHLIVGGDATVAGAVTASGVKPIVSDGTLGVTSYTGTTGGWAIGQKFYGSGGTPRAFVGARGTSDGLESYQIGDASLTSWATFDSTGAAVTGMITASGVKPLVVDPSTGLLKITGAVGGWRTGLKFYGSSGTAGGTIGAGGTSDTFESIILGDGSFTPWLTVTSTGIVALGSLTSGSSAIQLTDSTGMARPAALGTGASITTKYLRGDGSWQTLSFGDVTAASSFGADNRLLRSDGTGKGAQVSGVTLDDADGISTPGIITASGAKPIEINGATGVVSYYGTAGGWRIGQKFFGSSGTLGAFAGGAGTSDTVDNYFIGADAVTPWTTFTAAGVSVIGTITALGAAQAVTGSRAGNAALASLLTKLAAIGLITDGTS